MKSFKRWNGMLARFFQKTQGSRPFLRRGRFFWLGFVFPCLGAAQGCNESVNNSRRSQVEVDEDCFSANEDCVVVEDCFAVDEDCVVEEAMELECTAETASTEEEHSAEELVVEQEELIEPECTVETASSEEEHSGQELLVEQEELTEPEIRAETVSTKEKLVVEQEELSEPESKAETASVEKEQSGQDLVREEKKSSEQVRAPLNRNPIEAPRTQVGAQVPVPGPECYSKPSSSSSKECEPACSSKKKECEPACPSCSTCYPIGNDCPSCKISQPSAKSRLLYSKGEGPQCSVKEHICWPVPNASITLDFLYFYSMLENLRYAERVPQVANNSPLIANVEQKFSYDPGARVNVMVALDDYWELGATWTYYDANPDSTSATDPNAGIYASMQAPVFVTTGNPQCQNVKGKWGMRMNVFDVEFKKPFCIGNIFMFAPVIGAQGVTFRNTLRVQYNDYRIDDAGAQTPTRIKGTNDVWAVGPEVAIETRFLAPRKLDLFLRAGYSAMLGQFKAKTLYADLLFADPSGTIRIRNNSARLFSMWQIQAAFSKRWDVGNGLVELMAGYETQFWTGVNRWDYFGTLSIPSSDGNLMLSGPFGRLTVSF